MSDHASNSESDGHPMGSGLCAPAIHHITNSSVDERDAEGPETHFRFFDTAITTCEADDNLVREDTSAPSNKVSNKSGKENQTGRCCAPIVRWLCQNFGDGVE